MRELLAEERGVTLIEMLVVLAILGIVLAGMTTLFVSASTSHTDQSNRIEAQRNGRLALDGLRREIRVLLGRHPELGFVAHDHASGLLSEARRRQSGAVHLVRCRRFRALCVVAVYRHHVLRNWDKEGGVARLQRGFHVQPRDCRPDSGDAGRRSLGHERLLPARNLLLRRHGVSPEDSRSRAQ